MFFQAIYTEKIGNKKKTKSVPKKLPKTSSYYTIPKRKEIQHRTILTHYLDGKTKQN